jgi:phytol kinase
MIIQLFYIIIYLVGFYLIIQLSELIYHKYHLNPEITRKLAHILGSLTSLSFLLLFNSHWYILIISVTFFLLLFNSKRKGIYSSIDLVERNSMGSYLLPISIYLTFLISDLANDNLYFVLPVLILGICDPLAGFVGTNNKKARNIKIFSMNFQKTYIGSLTFFISTFVLTISTYIFFNYLDRVYGLDESILFLGLYFAFPLTFIEILSSRGLDNLTVPLFASILIWTIK